MIGQVFFPLSGIDVTQLQNEWKDLETSTETEQVLMYFVIYLVRPPGETTPPPPSDA